MLGLGIPCVCINLLGIAVSVTNTYIVDPIIYNDIKSNTAINLFDGSIETLPAIANADPIRFILSNNRFDTLILKPVVTPIAAFNNVYDGTVVDNELRNNNLTLNNVWFPPNQGNTDSNVIVDNRWLEIIPDLSQVKADIRNRYEVEASLQIPVNSREDNNTWLMVGSLNILGNPNNNNTYSTLLPLLDIKATTNNVFDALLANKEVIVDAGNNTWEVSTPILIKSITTNVYDTLISLIIPFVSAPIIDNIYDTEASLPNPIRVTTDNTYSTTIAVKPVLKASPNNTWNGIINGIQTILSTVLDNEYDTEIQLPFFVVTVNAVFVNEWDGLLEVEEKPKCPVPCGVAISTNKLRFVQTNLGTVEEIT